MYYCFQAAYVDFGGRPPDEGEGEGDREDGTKEKSSSLWLPNNRKQQKRFQKNNKVDMNKKSQHNYQEKLNLLKQKMLIDKSRITNDLNQGKEMMNTKVVQDVVGQDKDKDEEGDGVSIDSFMVLKNGDVKSSAIATQNVASSPIKTNNIPAATENIEEEEEGDGVAMDSFMTFNTPKKSIIGIKNDKNDRTLINDINVKSTTNNNDIQAMNKKNQNYGFKRRSNNKRGNNRGMQNNKQDLSSFNSNSNSNDINRNLIIKTGDKIENVIPGEISKGDNSMIRSGGLNLVQASKLKGLSNIGKSKPAWMD